MKQYSTYKDSGVEWVGEIPERWSSKPLFALFKDDKRPMKAIRRPMCCH